MSSLSDRVGLLRRTLADIQVPPELGLRITGYFEEIERLQNDIASQVHIEQLLDYIDWIVNLPWNKRSEDVIDIAKAKDMLDGDDDEAAEEKMAEEAKDSGKTTI